jgi:hypothetical protein
MNLTWFMAKFKNYLENKRAIFRRGAPPCLRAEALRRASVGSQGRRPQWAALQFTKNYLDPLRGGINKLIFVVSACQQTKKEKI